MLRRISESEWLTELRKPTAKQTPPISLCELPFSVKEMEDRYELNFISVEEEGLGTCFVDIVRINDVPYLFFGNGTKENKEICVYAKIIASEKPNFLCLDNLCEELCIKKEELRWVRELDE